MIYVDVTIGVIVSVSLISKANDAFITIDLVSNPTEFELHYISSKRASFVREDIPNLSQLLIQRGCVDPAWHITLITMHICVIIYEALLDDFNNFNGYDQ